MYLQGQDVLYILHPNFAEIHRRESKIHPMVVENQQLKNIEFNTLMSQINKVRQ